MKFSTLTKIVTGGVDQEQLAELLSSIGVEATLTPVGEGQARAEFQALWTAASLPPCEITVLTARMKNGAVLSGILVSKGPSNNAQIPTAVTKGTKNNS